MSRLQSIERQLGLHKQPEKIPAPETSGLGAAIQEIIDRAVQQQVKDALADREHQNPRVRSMMRDFAQPVQTAPVAPLAKSHPPTVQIERDGLRRAMAITVGKQRYLVRRGVDGQLVGLVPDDGTVSPQPAVGPAPLNEA